MHAVPTSGFIITIFVHVFCIVMHSVCVNMLAEVRQVDTRQYSTIGRSDLALFAVFEKRHVSADQVYF